MTREVLTVGPDTPIAEIAKVLLERRISGMPVIEDDEIIGIVSEGDFIRRPEIGTDKRTGSLWLKLFTAEQSPVDFIKIHGLSARDVMTRPAITVTEDAPLHEIADLFESRHIKRVPVMRDGKLVGIVSRANLVQALATASIPEATAAAKDDDTIRDELLKTLKAQPWWHPRTSHVIVSEGVVHIWGLDGPVDTHEAARVAAMNVAGVREVEDHRIERRSIINSE
jgi:CBS domain-containing protein